MVQIVFIRSSKVTRGRGHLTKSNRSLPLNSQEMFLLELHNNFSFYFFLGGGGRGIYYYQIRVWLLRRVQVNTYREISSLSLLRWHFPSTLEQANIARENFYTRLLHDKAKSPLRHGYDFPWGLFLTKSLLISSVTTLLLPRSWGGTNWPLPVSGIFFEWGKFPLGILPRICDELDPFTSLLRDTFSAMAAATREEWSVPMAWDDMGEFKSMEASGSFSIGGGNNGETSLNCWFDDDLVDWEDRAEAWEEEEGSNGDKEEEGDCSLRWSFSLSSTATMVEGGSEGWRLSSSSEDA